MSKQLTTLKPYRVEDKTTGSSKLVNAKDANDAAVKSGITNFAVYPQESAVNVNFIAIFGYSGAGKTYLSKRFSELKGIFPIEATGHIKREYERIYKLPKGTLSTKEGKEKVLPGTKITGQQFLEDLFHFYADRDPLFSTRGLEQVLTNVVENSKSITINGIRNQAELDLINRLVGSNPNINMVGLWIDCDLAEEKDTDINQMDLFNQLKGNKFIIKNRLHPDTFDNLINNL